MPPASTSPATPAASCEPISSTAADTTARATTEATRPGTHTVITTL
ncbi:hypothetical protein ACWCQZ_45010 [Streptomyces sp. NPDC002285]